MKILFRGFTLSCAGGVTLADLMAHVKATDAGMFAGYNRFIRVGEKGSYYVGLVLSAKDVRSICELEQKELVIKVRELQRGRSVVDFNFFVLHKKTGRGLYQHYHQSLGLSRFGALLDEQLHGLVQQKVQAAVQALGGTVSDKKLRVIKKDLRTHVELSPMVRSEEVGDLLDDMARISKLTYSVTSVTPDAHVYAPVRPFVRSSKTELTFSRDASVAKVRQAVLQLLEKVPARRGKVYGVGDDDHPQVVDIMENYGVYGELDYDAAAQTMNIPLDDFLDAPLAKQLLVKVKDLPAVFEYAAAED